MVRVGTAKNEYGTQRNISGAEVKGYRVVRVYDVFTLLHALLVRIGSRIPILKHGLYDRLKFVQNFHWGSEIPGVKLLHLWNTVSSSKKPWVVTYETALPRWENATYSDFELLARPSCKKIIALSDAAYRIQERRLRECPDLKKIILDKMCVLHPPQRLYVSTWEEKEVSLEGDIDFSIVGANIMQKGGLEVMKVFDQLIVEGCPVKLTIVGDLRSDAASKSDINLVQSLIEKHRKKVTYYPRVDNNKVIDIFLKSHVAMLPTYADTYGYVVLEAQACGTPVISSNIRAQQEINGGDAGWLIDVPIDDNRNALRGNVNEKEIYSNILESELYHCIKKILSDRTIIKRKGAASLGRIKKYHDPELHGEKLASIYGEALAKVGVFVT